MKHAIIAGVITGILVLAMTGIMWVCLQFPNQSIGIIFGVIIGVAVVKLYSEIHSYLKRR
jgi:tetrahydromethanopterin S-methyltransferase subunit G